MLLVKAVGFRVTSWRRDVETNSRVGGSPTSLHLVGGAVDFGREADVTSFGFKLVETLSEKGGLHKKGSAPHFHFEAGPKILVSAVVVLFLVGRVLS